MARQQSPTDLQQEVICPICLEILQDPVTTDCGHNFCLQCITQVSEASADFFKCPLCNSSVRKNAFTRNWLLVNLVDRIQAMDPSEMRPEVEEEEEEMRCPKHGEKLHYFCELDGKFLCVVCCGSKDHKSHNTSLIEEAAQSYQGQIQAQVRLLRQKEKEIALTKAQSEEKIDFFMAQVDLEKQRILAEFEHLGQALKEEKNFLLSRITWLGLEEAKESKFYSTATQAQLNSLRNLTDYLETKQRMPPQQLLKGIKSILHRSEEFQFLNLPPIPLDLEKKFSEAKSRHDFITENLRRFKDTLQADRKKDKGKFLKGMNEIHTKSWCLFEKHNPNPDNTSTPEPSSPVSGIELRLPRSRASFAMVPGNRASAANAESSRGAARTAELREALTPVTFDAASAHPDLVLSQDLKTVTLDLAPADSLEYAAGPESFYPFRCVLGSPGFSCGRHAWEAELRGPRGGACVVGVAWEQVARRGFLMVDPESGFWALRITDSECQALTGQDTRKDLPLRPRKVRVRVDVELGTVAFYDAATNTHLYTFHASFPGKIFPFFRLLFPGTQVILNP
ncbi:E3 ubiquitin-protein ligase TRIM31 [Lepus europaeus]|uniref:E3 ubiquitin-protein ligase TRIM31 n=1 Tax=Lepus europaeus TaxID=9983 RepID=UPI002B484A26|nr:E3 ubiquitin-protein ligase TRIM31 [Lepus europaeus]